MSVRALTWSFNLRLNDMAAKAALNALADHADEKGECWPSIARIALFCGCSDKTARRALKRLEDLGIIDRGTRSGQSDVYVLDFLWTPPTEGVVKMTPSQIDHSQVDQPPLPICPDPPPTLTGDPSQRGSRTTKNRQLNRQGTTNEQRAKLPTDWRPSVDDRNYAIDKGLDPETVAAAFIDYFTEGRGRREPRTGPGWSRRWRVWCNTDADRKPARGNPGFRPAIGDGGDAGAFARAAAILGGGKLV